MIGNYMCERCAHVLVCRKVDILEKFDSESKKYIDVDITMMSCKDFDTAERSEE